MLCSPAVRAVGSRVPKQPTWPVSHLDSVNPQEIQRERSYKAQVQGIIRSTVTEDIDAFYFPARIYAALVVSTFTLYLAAKWFFTVPPSPGSSDLHFGSRSIDSIESGDTGEIH